MTISRFRFFAACVLLLGLWYATCADEKSATPKPDAAKSDPATSASKSVEQIAESARQSVVVITYTARDGKRHGLGTGFVVSADGLIATNLHVIGEARPITVQTADRKRYEVTSVHASDRSLDLALVRIDAKDLIPLAIADSDALKEGQAVVAIGNPHGLAHSVVAGLVSGKREIDGRPMIQLAIPIEQGNSGGPLLDMEGRVQGILTMKSLVTRNLGFAIPINQLKPLLKKPNPIPMSRWLTLGTLDPAQWTVLFDARWKQRGSKILVEGAGSGFGGRSLCLSQLAVPQLPYEVVVAVRLDDEAGAAGLVFHADGGDKHYGFYPSAGQLRLTRFDGPDVYSWKILRQESSPHYRPGDWNLLKVRLEKDQIQCYVNNHLVFESNDTGLTSGKVGLAKFRETRAEFKGFQMAKKIPTSSLPAELVKRINSSLEDVSEVSKSNLVDSLLPEAVASVTVLRERAKLLEEQAMQLRELALAVHYKRVQADLAKTLQSSEEDINLLQAALLVARLDNDELDIDVYRKEVERMVRELSSGLSKDADDGAKLAALNKYLFAECGFHGSRTDYYNRSNSYLNDVIDDREGLPITLSVLYMELARRMGLRVVGIGLPGHFVVKHVPAKGEGQLIDVYEQARSLSLEEARKKVQAITDRPPREAEFAPVTKKAIIVRMLHNLMGLTREDGDVKGALRYLDTILAIAPESAQERALRAAARFQTGNKRGALEDVDWLLDHQPDGVNLDRIHELRRLITRPDR
jgi:regulator of sirC expression with transglutaminase-like and TPR domain